MDFIDLDDVNRTLELVRMVRNLGLVQVVRCKDCRHCKITPLYPVRDSNPEIIGCYKNERVEFHRPDFYCADGDRKIK